MKVLHKTEENTEHGLHKCIASRLGGLAMSGQIGSKPCTTTELSFSMQHPTCFLLPKDKNVMTSLQTTSASVCNSLSLATPNPHRNPKQRSRNLYGQNYGWLPLCEIVERSWMHKFCHIIISTATTPNRNLCHQEHPFARDTSGFGTWRSSRISRGNQRKVYRSDNIHVIYIVWHMYACTYSMSVLFHVYTYRYTCIEKNVWISLWLINYNVWKHAVLIC